MSKAVGPALNSTSLASRQKPLRTVNCHHPTHLKSGVKKNTKLFVEYICINPACFENILMCTQCQTDTKCDNYPHSFCQKALFSDFLNQAADGASKNTSNVDNNSGNSQEIQDKQQDLKPKEESFITKDLHMLHKHMRKTTTEIMHTFSKQTEEITGRMLNMTATDLSLAPRKAKLVIEILKKDADYHEIESAAVKLKRIYLEEKKMINPVKKDNVSLIVGKKAMLDEFHTAMITQLNKSFETLKEKIFASPPSSSQDNVVNKDMGELMKKFTDEPIKLRNKEEQKDPHNDPKLVILPPKNSQLMSEFIKDSTVPIEKDEQQQPQSGSVQEIPAKTSQLFRKLNNLPKKLNPQKSTKFAKKGNKAGSQMEQQRPKNSMSEAIDLTESVIVVNHDPPQIPVEKPYENQKLPPHENQKLPFPGFPHPSTVFFSAKPIHIQVPSPLIPPRNSQEPEPKVESIETPEHIPMQEKDAVYILDSDDDESDYLHMGTMKKMKSEVEVSLSSWNTSITTNADTVKINPKESVALLNFKCNGLTVCSGDVYFASPHTFEQTDFESLFNRRSAFKSIGRSPTQYYKYLHAFTRGSKNLSLLSINAKGEPKILDFNMPFNTSLKVPDMRIICCDISAHNNIVVASTETGSLLVWHLNENKWAERTIGIKGDLLHIIRAEDQSDKGTMRILMRGKDGFNSFKVNFWFLNNSNNNHLDISVDEKAEVEAFGGYNITQMVSYIHDKHHFYFSKGNEIYVMNLNFKRKPQVLFEFYKTMKIEQIITIDCRKRQYLLVFKQSGMMKNLGELTMLCVEDQKAVVIAELDATIGWENEKPQVQFVKRSKGSISLFIVAKRYNEEDPEEKDHDYWLENISIDLLD